MNLEINKNLFAAWCGMIISGYNLFDKNNKEILYLCNEIKDTEHKNIEFQNWIKASKYYINKIIENDNFSELLDSYINVLNKKFNDIDNQINSIKDKLDKYNFPTDIEIIFAPNLLQSKYLADYVFDNSLFIIAADFSEETAIHEYLHIIVKSKQKEFEKLLQKRNINDLINVSEMQTLGYLKDFSIENKIHALEEQFVKHYTNLLK